MGAFLKQQGYEASFIPNKIEDTHFFVIDKAAMTYELSNVTKRIKTRFDITQDEMWQPKLMEELLKSAYLEPYYIRLKPGVFEKAEKDRKEKGLSKSAIGNLIFSAYYKNEDK